MVIQHNLAAMFGDRQYNITINNKAKHAEKLSSGYRINRAADDAAGLAISEKMRREIRGLHQGSANIQDGISLCQVADGYLHEVHDMIQRINELAVKGANDTLTDDDRSYLNEEVQAIKGEMSRIFDSATFNEKFIFHVPYMPEVTPDPEPYDLGAFYGSSGKIGGLTFNGVRYSIEELRNIPSNLGDSLKLDSNGVATEDQTVTFKLNYENGEEVKLSLKAGDTLDKVKRNYSWKADSTGISINNVRATTWEELGIDATGAANSKKTASFNYRGSKISFEIEEGHTISQIMSGINGDSFATPSTWDVSVAGGTPTTIAPIYGSTTLNNGSTVSSNNHVKITNANKNDINDEYRIAATTSGLSIKNLTDGTQTSETGWSSFTNVNRSGVGKSSADNNSYPIKDWGIDNDWGTGHPNDSSEITFDTDALYHYVSPNSDIPIQYYFGLSGAASQSEVINALNNSQVSGNIHCPTTTTSSNSAITLSSKRIDGGGIDDDTAFALQNAYGRNFDSTNARNATALTGNITYTVKAGETTPEQFISTTSGNPTTTNTSNSLTSTDKYFKVELDDGSFEYYKVTENQNGYRADYQYVNNFSWTEKYHLEYEGNLGTANMQKVEGHEVAINVKRTDTVTFSHMESWTTYSNIEKIDDISNYSVDESNFVQKARDEFEEGRNYNFSSGNSSETVSPGQVQMNGTYTENASFLKQGESDTNNYAFKFTHNISYQDIVNLGNGGTGSTTITTKTPNNNNWEAYRDLNPVSKSGRLNELDFLNISVNAPEKHCIIQCAPNAGDPYEIDLTWSPLNLSIAGISGADLSTTSRSRATIDIAKESLKIISEERSTFGAYQNRLEHAMKYVDNTAENTQASESRIRDTNMAKEMTELSNADIIAQAGQMILSQANQTPQGVLQLLQ